VGNNAGPDELVGKDNGPLPLTKKRILDDIHDLKKFRYNNPDIQDLLGTKGFSRTIIWLDTSGSMGSFIKPAAKMICEIPAYVQAGLKEIGRDD